MVYWSFSDNLIWSFYIPRNKNLHLQIISLYTWNIDELFQQQPVGTTVIQVSATDADHGKNAEVHYYLAPEKDYTKFQIHKDTGLLTTRAVLDREQQAQFEVSRRSLFILISVSLTCYIFKCLKKYCVVIMIK